MANVFTPQLWTFDFFLKSQLKYFRYQAELHATLPHCAVTLYQFSGPYNIVLPWPESLEVCHFKVTIEIKWRTFKLLGCGKWCCRDQKIGMEFGLNSMMHGVRGKYSPKNSTALLFSHLTSFKMAKWPQNNGTQENVTFPGLVFHGLSCGVFLFVAC